MTQSNLIIARLPRDKEHPFTVTSNDKRAFNWDTSLSPGAYGVLCKVLSLNGEKDFSVPWLCQLLNVGKSSAQSLLKELVQAGYLVIERTRNELGKFSGVIYHFYEVSQNLREGEQPSAFCASPQPKSPDVEKPQQLNTTMSLNTSLQSVCPVSEQTEDLKNWILEMTAFSFLPEGEFKNFVSEILPYLAEISSQPELYEKLTAMQKKEQSLLPFLKKLEKRCQKALKNLKVPDAKEKFLLSTVRNAVLEYTFSASTETPAPKTEQKTLSFHEILHQMGSSLCELPEKFESEEELSCFDPADRAIEECTIPANFLFQPEAMEQALKFLFCYSNLENNDYKQFTGAVSRCLAEAACTGKINSIHGTDAEAILHRLNEINQREDEGSLVSWLNGFSYHYSEKCKETLAKGTKIRNPFAYLKSCAVNYLLKDSCAGDPRLYETMF